MIASLSAHITGLLLAAGRAGSVSVSEECTHKKAYSFCVLQFMRPWTQLCMKFKTQPTAGFASELASDQGFKKNNQ